MTKLGENVPLLIDKAVDFMASSQAFREYLNKTPRVMSFLTAYRRKTRRCIYNAWIIIDSSIDQNRKRNCKREFVYF